MIAIPKPEEIYPHLNPEAQYRVSREYYRNRSLKRLLSVAGSSFLPVALSVASWGIILNPALNASIKTMLGQEVARTEVVESNNNAIAVVDAATAWTGKSYKPGVAAMCASFVRTVLTESGVDIPVPAGSWGPLMADSFYAPESGEIIHDKTQLRPGDIVMFANTYNGPGRVINGRKITHVGIYLGDGMMADRPTRSRPVQHRSINTFEFHSALRPSDYQVKIQEVDGNLLQRAIGHAEGTRDANGNPTTAYYGHTDPGNRAHNLGSFSYQHGAASPKEADRKWLEVLDKAKTEINQQALDKFNQPLSNAAMVAALDAYTQSPDAAKNYFIEALVSADPSEDELVSARITALNKSRAKLGGAPLNVSADQRRRIDRILDVLN